MEGLEGKCPWHLACGLCLHMSKLLCIWIAYFRNRMRRAKIDPSRTSAARLSRTSIESRCNAGVAAVATCCCCCCCCRPHLFFIWRFDWMDGEGRCLEGLILLRLPCTGMIQQPEQESRRPRWNAKQLRPLPLAGQSKGHGHSGPRFPGISHRRPQG